MRYIVFLLLIFGLSQKSFSQIEGIEVDVLKSSDQGQKGKLYAYWGWNISWYTDSDIHFKGEGFDFVLEGAEAIDKQPPFAFDPYFHPTKITIPQTNFKVGYYFSPLWDLSLGFDHMKYVLRQGQTLNISGTVNLGSEDHDGTYNNDEKILTPDFLDFEHTDGLNYIHLDLRRNLEMFKKSWLSINGLAGVSSGLLIPRTRTILLGSYNRDAYKISGMGVALVLGLNITIKDGFFIQSEWKGGYINMPSVRISSIDSEKASHSFYFHQLNLVFGYGYSF